MNLIQFDHVSYVVDDKKVLSEVSFSLKKGDFLNVVGPNGGGKTTLIELMTSLIKPTSGLITVNTNRVGYLQQIITAKRNFPLTVKEFLLLSFKKNTKEHLDLIKSFLLKADLLDVLNRNLNTLSGGQLQRIYLIRSLINYPDLLILDEPTNALDPSFKKEFYDLLNTLHKEGKTTIINVTHHLDDVFTKETLTLYLDEKITYFGSTQGYLKENGHV